MLTQSYLKELFEYDSKTGRFKRKISRGNAKKGNFAGAYSPTSGYMQIKIDGKSYLSHRLVWLYEYGFLPNDAEIDHLNGKKTDNRLCNLRMVRHQCNMQNKKIYTKNTSGIPGVYWYKAGKKWGAKLALHSKNYHLGYYSDLLEAALARLTAKINCPEWKCNYRSETVKNIQKIWSGLNIGK